MVAGFVIYGFLMIILISIPIVLIIAGIGALVDNWGNVKANFRDLKKWLKKFFKRRKK